MKRLLLFLVITFLFVAGASAKSAREIREHAAQISNAIAVPFYSYDLRSVESVISSFVKAEASILAVEIIDVNSEEVVYAGFKDDDTFSAVKTIPAENLLIFNPLLMRLTTKVKTLEPSGSTILKKRSQFQPI